MSDPEKTDINWKLHWIELRGFLAENWDYMGPIAGFIVGLLIGVVL